MLEFISWIYLSNPTFRIDEKQKKMYLTTKQRMMKYVVKMSDVYGRVFGSQSIVILPKTQT